MTFAGQLCLLVAFVASGWAAFASIAGARPDRSGMGRTGVLAGLVSVAALTAVMGVLAWALVTKDFRFAYVAQYSSRLLPWHYSLSALWVGQAGSLLLWAWLLGVLALAYRFWPLRNPNPLRQPAFGVLMAYLGFLVAIMVFAADPVQPTLGKPQDGAGLSPLLQHPAMLIHPPVVFLGYAAWAIPFAVALTSLVQGRLDAGWVREARPWALLAWTVLGIGILLGAQWAYEELGWGGYWGWDPVENGSFIPWLTGTAMIHCAMAWQRCGALKKTSFALATATFALCNFASFLTRSGIFSSLHAFSQSPIGWMFLVLMAALLAGSGALLVVRRAGLRPAGPIAGLRSRESLALIASVAMLLLAGVALAGTLSAALTKPLFGEKIVVGPEYYNYVLIPTGLVLLATVALAPLARWGARPSPAQDKATLIAVAGGLVAAGLGLASGLRHPVGLAVIALAATAACGLAGALLLDAWRRVPGRPWWGVLRALRDGRRSYAGFMVHMGFVSVALGVAGSSLGTRSHDVVLREGESVEWAGRSIRLAHLTQRALPDKLVVEAHLEIAGADGDPFHLAPAQHYHLLQNEWTTEVDIHSTWAGDFYAILQHGEGAGRAGLSLVENPMMRWMWFGGWLAGIGALAGLWPLRVRLPRRGDVPPPKQRAARPARRPLVASARHD